MSAYGEWLKVDEINPPHDVQIMCAVLNRYVNARWEYTVYKNIRYGNGCWLYREPDYWMPFPTPPRLTKEEERESENCYQTERAKKIAKLEAELKKVKSCR